MYFNQLCILLIKIKQIICVVFMVYGGCFISQVYAEQLSPSSPTINGEILEDDRIHINRADVTELADKMKGIGLKKAQAIVDYRLKHGNFQRIEDLLFVSGIGEKVLKDNHGFLSIE